MVKSHDKQRYRRGQCTLKDDTGFQYVIKQVTLDFNVIDLVTNAEFTLKATSTPNQIKIPIKKQKPKTASALQTIQKSVLILFKHFLDFCLIIRFS